MKRLLSIVLITLIAGTVLAEPPVPADTKAQLRQLYFEAARAGDLDKLGAFIEAHFDLNIQDERGYTGLILAAYHGHQAAVEQLLAAGADPCAQDARGNTALMGAVFKGELTIARRLVAADCSPDQRNHSGQTAAMYAALFHRQDILDALAARGADFSAQDALGNDVQALAKGQFQPLPER